MRQLHHCEANPFGVSTGIKSQPPEFTIRAVHSVQRVRSVCRSPGLASPHHPHRWALWGSCPELQGVQSPLARGQPPPETSFLGHAKVWLLCKRWTSLVNLTFLSTLGMVQDTLASECCDRTTGRRWLHAYPKILTYCEALTS